MGVAYYSIRAFCSSSFEVEEGDLLMGAPKWNKNAVGGFRAALVDMTGMQVHRLKVVSRAIGVSPTSWNCICSCGTRTVVQRNTLRSGKVKSCGCYAKERGHWLGKNFGGTTRQSSNPNAERIREWRRNYRRSNIKKFADINRKYRAELTDNYVRHLMGFKRGQVAYELIEAKRAHLRVQRLLKGDRV